VAIADAGVWKVWWSECHSCRGVERVVDEGISLTMATADVGA
jgi:hypothetical protein